MRLPDDHSLDAHDLPGRHVSLRTLSARGLSRPLKPAGVGRPAEREAPSIAVSSLAVATHAVTARLNAPGPHRRKIKCFRGRTLRDIAFDADRECSSEERAE